MELTKEDRFPYFYAWFGMNKAFANELAVLALPPLNTLSFVIFQEIPGISQDELSKLIGGNKNNASSLVKRMTSSGLIARKPNKVISV